MRTPIDQLSFAILQPAATRPPAAHVERQRKVEPAKADLPDQLQLALAQPGSAVPVPLAGEGSRPAPASPIALVALHGGSSGSGHRRARLVALSGGAAPARPLPTRDEITTALLGGLADLVAGRISAAGASAIREAAEDALRQLDAAERDPHRAPQFVRAARALQELI